MHRPTPRRQQATRARDREDGRRLVNSTATLILVPSQLLGQWQDEIAKFTGARGSTVVER